MLLNLEELLALANGDVEPEGLGELLDRLDRCPESSEALHVLVTLKANREEALEALRLAAETESPSAKPMPHPAARRASSTSWAASGMRLAASIALIAMVAWGVNAYWTATPRSAAELAMTEYFNFIRPGAAELTSDAAINEALRALDDGRFEEARDLLVGVNENGTGRATLLLGMSQYWLGEYDAAATTLGRIHRLPEVEDGTAIRLQALWYEANALLALDAPVRALPLVEEVRTRRLFTAAVGGLRERAEETYDELCALLGINNTGTSSQ